MSNSARELKNMGWDGAPEFVWNLSNLQMWVSMDASTCLEGVRPGLEWPGQELC